MRDLISAFVVIVTNWRFNPRVIRLLHSGAPSVSSKARPEVADHQPSFTIKYGPGQMVTRTITAIWRRVEEVHLSVSIGANLLLLKERVKSLTGFQLYTEVDGHSDRKSLIRM